MKLNYILLLIGATALTAGCERNLQFSARDLANSGAPGVECELTNADLNAPSIVEQDQDFPLEFQRNNVSWILTNGSKEISASGSRTTLALKDLGLYEGKARGTNNCGKDEEETFQIKVIEKVEALSLVINNDDPFTRSTQVQLKIEAKGADQMFLTNDSSCQIGNWAPYSKSNVWTLGETNKSTRVFVKFKNALRETNCIGDEIMHDDVPPKVWFVSSPNGYSNQSSVSLEFGVQDVTSGVKDFFCKIDQNLYKTCDLTVTFDNLDEGSHTVSIYANDKAGNISQEESVSWIVDTKAPSVRITEKPDSLSNTKTALFKFEGDDHGTPLNLFECSIDGAKYTACTTPKTYTTLSEGNHTFKVQGIDQAGNKSFPAEYSWTIDSIAPIIKFTKTPPALSNVNTSEFEFTVSDSGSGVDSIFCKIDQEPETSCFGSASFDLPRGKHRFAVRALDKAKNASTATYEWVIDTLVNQDIPITDSNSKADILFVVDNSESMAWSLIPDVFPYRFQNFISSLGAMDYRLAFTTATTMSDKGGYQIRPPEIYEDGGLADILSSSTPGYGLPVFPATKFISSNDDPQVASQNFLATLMRPEVICKSSGGMSCPPKGSPMQYPIHASLLSIKKTENKVFFRDNTDLHVVILTDTDEGDGTLTDAHGYIKQGTPDYPRPDNFVKKFKEKWPNKDLKVHGVFRRPLDKYCALQTDKGLLINTLVNMTGGTSGSICNKMQNDQTEIKKIADAIKQSQKHTFDLRCVPVSGSLVVTFDPHPSYPVNYTLNGKEISFKPLPPMGTNINLKYRCP